MTKKILKLAAIFFLSIFIADTATFALPSNKAAGGFTIKRGTNISHRLSESKAIFERK